MNKIKFIKKTKIFQLKKKKILLISIIFIIYLIIKFGNIINRINYDKIINYSIYDAAKKAKKFLKITYKGLLFSKKRIILASNPKVSVVIPVYNKQNYIKHTIRSIQNQNMLDIDIVIVNDFSSDNTSKIIEELKKEDKRIRVINNKKNMGTLYTRCIGTLAAKGRYIFPLDGDDMFLDKDIVKNVY